MRIKPRRKKSSGGEELVTRKTCWEDKQLVGKQLVVQTACGICMVWQIRAVRRRF